MEWSIRHSTPAGDRGKVETPQAQRGGSDSSSRKASVRSAMERTCCYKLTIVETL
ncbi:hypothetical protein [Priestia flexa]|uniref:hypothetical protein n=1 Tax=Priestia flexa TaxID=86664 RepID=UPI00158B32D0|nr:hypothetical protein [Priestia flexa]MBY6086277.1 hypothetical protein [Priestia flexa]